MRGPIVPNAGPRMSRLAPLVFVLAILSLVWFVVAWTLGGAPGTVPLVLYALAQGAQRLLAYQAMRRLAGRTSVRDDRSPVSSRP